MIHKEEMAEFATTERMMRAALKAGAVGKVVFDQVMSGIAKNKAAAMAEQKKKAKKK